MKLSIFCYVKNEEATLEKALLSIREIADELVVVDTGSSDNTIAIAKKYADVFAKWAWRDDFGAAARYAESLCTNRFVCKWDGDWWLEQGKEQILKLKQEGFVTGSKYVFSWINEFDIATLIPTIIHQNEFIYDREYYQWVSPIHTHLKSRYKKQSPKIINMSESVAVYHYKNRDTKHYRYHQTNIILKGYLPKTSGQEQYSLLVYGLKNAIFLEEYSEAEEFFIQIFSHSKFNSREYFWVYEMYGVYLLVTQQYLKLENFLVTHANIQSLELDLLKADLILLQNDFEQAKKLYQNFIITHNFSGKEFSINFKRMIDHPKNMLQYIDYELQK